MRADHDAEQVEAETEAEDMRAGAL